MTTADVNYASILNCSRAQLRDWIRDTLTGQSLVPGNPEIPEMLTAELYRHAERSARVDIEHSVFDLLLSYARNSATWAEEHAEALIRLADPVLVGSEHRAEAAAIFVTLLKQVDNVNVRRALIQGITVLRLRLPSSVWLEEYARSGDALIGALFEALALTEPDAFMQFTLRVTWTAAAVDAFFTVINALLADRGAYELAPSIQRVLHCWPSDVVEPLVTLFDHEGISLLGAAMEREEFWLFYLRSVLQGTASLSARDVLSGGTDSRHARRTFALAAISEYSTQRGHAAYVRVLEQLSVCDNVEVLQLATTILNDTYDGHCTVRGEIRDMAMSLIKDSTGALTTLASESSRTHDPLRGALRRVLLRATNDKGCCVRRARNTGTLV
ncbi:MAG: hypothetical protein JO093_09640 [Acidobacteria bacterium]|nr:hypothetical protein [Acidobacteriota bacterium]